jgi:carbonic anhydrase/acetyltransferase-like protein (isoleucine patch superfamily)
MPGVEIGHGAVIGAGSVVTKSVPDFAVSYGVPARVCKYRFSKAVIDFLLEIAWWDWDEEKIRRNHCFFNMDLTECNEAELASIIR